jgi:hypothetical protein
VPRAARADLRCHRFCLLDSLLFYRHVQYDA